MSSEQPTAYGYCECGCGQKTTVSDRTHTQYGHVKGEPMRYIRGHAMRGKKLSAEARARVGAAHAGRPKSAEQRAKMSAAQRGAKGPNWHGGRIEREGRTLIYVGREHPMADTYGYVYEHRLVLAQAMGRMLVDGHVHHVDCDPTNNALDNLVYLAGSSEHTRVHARIRAGMAPIDALREVVCGG